MTDKPAPLDPDEVACPKCEAPAGSPCRQPNGERARAIHVPRRRLALNGGHKINRPAPKRNPRAGDSPATAEGRSKGGKIAQQNRRRRKAELAAAIAEQIEQEEQRAIKERADALAADAARYATDRAVLRRHVLDATTKAYEQLIAGLDGIQRVEVDADGRPQVTAQEYEDNEGRTRTRIVPDVRGAYSASHVERLAKIAASTINSLRLEEGKPTGITETQSGTVAAQLGEAGVTELLTWAEQNLGEKGGAS